MVAKITAAALFLLVAGRTAQASPVPDTDVPEAAQDYNGCFQECVRTLCLPSSQTFQHKRSIAGFVVGVGCGVFCACTCYGVNSAQVDMSVVERSPLEIAARAAQNSICSDEIAACSDINGNQYPQCYNDAYAECYKDAHSDQCLDN